MYSPLMRWHSAINGNDVSNCFKPIKFHVFFLQNQANRHRTMRIYPTTIMQHLRHPNWMEMIRAMGTPSRIKMNATILPHQISRFQALALASLAMVIFALDLDWFIWLIVGHFHWFHFVCVHHVVGANFRIVQTPDSDDEPTPDSSPIIQPNVGPVPAIKVNGVHTASTAPAYSSGVDDDQPNERNSRRKRNHSLTTTNYHFTNYSSHSSSRLSNSSSDDDDISSDDSSLPFFSSNHLSKRQKQTADNDVSHPSMLRCTPSRARDPKDCELPTPDTGMPGSTSRWSST